MKLYYKYEWKDDRKAFVVSKADSAHRSELGSDVKKTVGQLVKLVATGSGLKSRVDGLVVVVFFLFFVAGFVAGGLLLTHRHWGGGVFFLVFTPFVGFAIFVSRVVRGSRYERLQAFMIDNEEYFKELLEPAGLAMSSYFFEGKILIDQCRPTSRNKRASLRRLPRATRPRRKSDSFREFAALESSRAASRSTTGMQLTIKIQDTRAASAWRQSMTSSWSLATGGKT